ncbi:MAG: GAF domain-containing protein [Sphaerospermopsis sp.]|uniref:GAF domain-containing protein n=1 Tax=Sphaerospermopsis sp. LEGE 00249 TaxID=1380707 RepID=UPI00164E423A|nr:GAF domain-containing protein [Sphaerospermopsis sp. LEGE 00249]MEB3151649.1 GAF domain-containing protein [Sphaerospermopsis sp.]
MQIHSQAQFESIQNQHQHQQHIEKGLQTLLDRLIKKINRDNLIRKTIHQIREALQVDRVVIYYFYEQWHGQVTFESLRSKKLSILGSKGADNCFNNEYATLYLDGRIRAIADIELETIHPCHQDFLRSIQVRANLVVPIVIPRGLWGLLVAHQCHNSRVWSKADIEIMQKGAQTLATNSKILES